MGKKRPVVFYVLIGVCVLLLACGAGFGFFLIRNGLNEERYQEYISVAKQYYSEARYSDAIIEYQNAIDQKDDEEEAYIGLANSYLAIGKTSSAVMTLEQGYEITKSVALHTMIADVQQRNNLVNTMNSDPEKVNLKATRVTGWNTPFLQKIENYTNDDFEKEFGAYPNIKKTGKGELDVIYPRLNAVFHYANTVVDDKIVDELKGKPAGDAMPEQMMLDDLNLLLNNCTFPLKLETLQSFNTKKISVIEIEKKPYVQFNYNSLIVTIACDKNGTIQSSDAENVIRMPNANRNREKTGIVQGIVINAVSGEGLPGAKLTFNGKSSSSNVAVASTDANGVFTVVLNPDMYEVTVEAVDYIKETFSMEVEEGRNYYGVQFNISSNLEEGMVRIVLEWNEEPRDLDSYLVGDTENGEDVFVSFTNMVSASGGRTLAELDVDDTNGNGPETITLYETRGTYKYIVKDYNETYTMGQSGATVKVYLPGQSAPTVISLSPNSGVENVWEVFTIENGKITVLNKAGNENSMSYQNK